MVKTLFFPIPTFILLCCCVIRIICEKAAVRLHLQTALHMLIRGLVNARWFDLKDTGCVQKMWTTGGLNN